MAPRGRLKIFLGMAPGVGKTYQMLEEGHEERSRGRDVVIGYLEPHGRAETLSQAAGLETVPRRRVDYRAVTLEEMDLAAILRRLCLIDELAHTNVPGCEHSKRHEDVDAVLEAGIDVYTTVNVQHVESLAGQIAALTGISVRETLPDRVLDAADDVVLVDITPELLLERLRAGKIYTDPSAAIAEREFFRPERLATLRQLSLLEVTEETQPGRRTAKQGRAVRTRPTGKPIQLAASRPRRAAGRVLALATPDPGARAIVYHAFRTAERLHVPLDVLWVRRGPGTIADKDEDVEALKRLVSTLGGTLVVRPGKDLVATTTQVALERGTTYILIGRPRRRTRLGTVADQRLPLQLMNAFPTSISRSSPFLRCRSGLALLPLPASRGLKGKLRFGSRRLTRRDGPRNRPPVSATHAQRRKVKCRRQSGRACGWTALIRSGAHVLRRQLGVIIRPDPGGCYVYSAPGH